MEFTNFYTNIKTENGTGPGGGWAGMAAAPAPATIQDKTKVNPFMQWAFASIQGYVFSGPQPGPAPAPPTDQPGTIASDFTHHKNDDKTHNTGELPHTQQFSLNIFSSSFLINFSTS